MIDYYSTSVHNTANQYDEPIGHSVLEAIVNQIEMITSHLILVWKLIL